MTPRAHSHGDQGRNAAKALSLLVLSTLSFGPVAAWAGRPATATPVVPDAAPAVTYDPALVYRVGVTYARHPFDFSHAFTNAPAAAPVAADLKRLHVRFSNTIDDEVRERIVATLSSGDAARAKTLQALFANDDFLDHATEAIRVFGLRETDLADIASALLIAGYDASHPVSLTTVQGQGLASDVRAAMLASPLLPSLDDATKQSIATEMSYQLLFWEFDASVFGGGQNPAAFARLHESIAASLATLGVPLGAMRPTDAGVELVASPHATGAPRPAPR